METFDYPRRAEGDVEPVSPVSPKLYLSFGLIGIYGNSRFVGILIGLSAETGMASMPVLFFLLTPLYNLSMVRIISANLNGVRSASNKGFYQWLQTQDADFVCLQELKAQAADMTEGMLRPEGWFGYFHYAEKKGYSGVGIYSKNPAESVIEGLGYADIDSEGRYLEIRFGNLSIISLYLPSGSSSEERQAVKYSVMDRIYPHLNALMASGRDVVICGDWNIAHKEIDLKNWRGNQKNSGFLPEERVWLTRVFAELGWVDVYRSIHPDTTDECYTWWSNRGQAWAKNVGWRIDYQIATPGIAGKAAATSIYKAQRFSDHAPLIVDYDLSLPGK